MANAPDQSVMWSAAGGTVDGNDLYTAGSTPGTFTVTARSVFDPSVTGTASVLITEPTALSLVLFCFAQFLGPEPEKIDRAARPAPRPRR